MKTRKIILLLILGMFSAGLFAQKLSDSDFYNSQLSKSFSVYDNYSDIFDVMESEPIKKLPDGKNAVRLISKGYDSWYVISLTWSKGSRTIDFTKGNGDGKKIIRKKTLDVSDEDVRQLVALITEKDFFSQPTLVPVSVRGADTWFVEANIDGKYNAVERWDSSNNCLYAIGRRLLHLAGEGPSDEELEKAKKEIEEQRNSRKLPIKKR